MHERKSEDGRIGWAGSGRSSYEVPFKFKLVVINAKDYEELQLGIFGVEMDGKCLSNRMCNILWADLDGVTKLDLHRWRCFFRSLGLFIRKVICNGHANIKEVEYVLARLM